MVSNRPMPQSHLVRPGNRSGSHVLVQAVMSAIDDYAERETGNREYFWNNPHKAG